MRLEAGRFCFHNKTTIIYFMSNQIQIFNFDNQNVRTVKIENETFFIAYDVCLILGHTNPSVAIHMVEEEDKTQIDPKLYLGSKSNQPIWIINESGLYSLILRSNKPEAKKFKKWITSEVLPSIRKTGKYQIDNPYAIASKKDLLKLALEQEEKIETLEIQSKQKDIMIEEHIKSAKDLTFRDTAKELNLKPNKFCEKLREQRYIRSGNEAYQRYIDSNIFCCKFIKDAKTNISYPRYYITPKGFEYFAKKKEQGFYDDIKN